MSAESYGLEPGPGDGDQVSAVELPAAQGRAGFLTQPAWLVAFSTPENNDPIRRGRWIRESLLCGHVPEVTIDGPSGLLGARAAQVIPALEGQPQRIRERVARSARGFLLVLLQLLAHLQVGIRR